MDIAVTGSHGLIASFLVPALEQQGHTVRRMVRGSATGTDIAWDPANGVLDPAALDGIGAVINLAGAGIGDEKWTPERKRLVVESRTKGTALLAEALAGRKDTSVAFLSGSAIGFYGNRGDEICTEESGPGKQFLSEVCEQWEAAAAPAQAAGIRTVLLRTGVVLTPKGGALQPLLLPFKLGLGGKVGSGKQWFSWIHVEDEVRGIIAALERPDVDGPVNLTAPNPVQWAEFAKTLGAALNRPTILPTPKPALYARLGKEAATEMVLEGQRVIPQKLTAKGHEFSFPDLRAALDDLL